MRADDYRSLAEFLKYQMVMNGITSTKKLGECIGVSQGTAWRLISRPRTHKDETLRLIAEAFHVPITEIRELANRPTGEPEHFLLPPEADQLTNRERDAVVELIWTLLDAHDRGRVTR